MLSRLTSERAQQVLLLRTSQRYLDRLAASLIQKSGQEAKFRRHAGLLPSCVRAARVNSASQTLRMHMISTPVHAGIGLVLPEAMYLRGTRLAQEVEDRRQALQASRAANAPKLAMLLDKTRQLKAHVEETLTTALKRPVLVVGEVNAVLS